MTHSLTIDRTAKPRPFGAYLYYPVLRLSGRWLERAGFQYRGRVRVEVEPGRIVITPER